MQIFENVDLEKYNTLHLLSKTRYYVKLTQINQLNDLRNYINIAKLKFFVLGGGSNIILPDEYNGLVIHNHLKGIVITKYDKEHSLVKVAAGENWDHFVYYSLVNGCYGLENLSLIPGTVGAAPIQNIGAYGVEVKDFIHEVEVFNIITGEMHIFSNSECLFQYRDSRFKREQHYIVVSVTFKLLNVAKLNITYGDLVHNMKQYSKPQALDLRNEVIKIRSSKLPDPNVIGNVGSFFHNPILGIEHAKLLQQKYTKLPIYPVDDQHVKISAGWLIDNLGLKGYSLGKVGIYDKQALVLVNLGGGANKTDVLNLANYIIKQVYNVYNIRLNIEPIQI